MSTIVLSPSHDPARATRRFVLTATFLAFCYLLLSWRAVLLSDIAPFLSGRRLAVLGIGAGFFWVALGWLAAADRVSLARVASWIVAGTALVLSARLFIDWLVPGVPQTFNYDLRWSLAWGGYFGMWIMGAIGFGRRRTPAAETMEYEPADALERWHAGWDALPTARDAAPHERP